VPSEGTRLRCCPRRLAPLPLADLRSDGLQGLGAPWGAGCPSGTARRRPRKHRLGRSRATSLHENPNRRSVPIHSMCALI
jgi:hypothetical protein